MNEPSSSSNADLAARFWHAIESGNSAKAKAILEEDRTLVARNYQPDSLHTDGFPLVQAAKQGNLPMVRLLLEQGADPDAKLDIAEPRESGMPLMHAFEAGRLDIVNLLLDHGASVYAFPYCSTPFVDCVYNATWDCPEHAELVGRIIRQSFGNYLRANDVEESELPDVSAANETVQLLARSVQLGGQPSLFTVVRHQPMELIEDLLRAAANQPGTRMDWPQGTVFDNLCYGASWTGYPDVLELCMRIFPELFNTDSAKHSIERAIRSHNRDGGIDEYERLIRSQLDYLKQNSGLTESYSDGKPFLPLHWLADDFIEPKNYGFKCPRLSTPDDLIRLARLFIDCGLDVNARHPESGLTPLDAARKSNQIAYADFLLQHKS